MKRISIFIMAATLATAGYSQSFGLGLKGGLNFPSVDALGLEDGADVSDLDGKSGYHIGAFARIKISKLAIQPEVLYSFQSFDYSADFTDLLGPDAILEASQNISYLTVPVMVKLYLVAGLNLQAGPQFGFLLNGETELSGLVNETEDITETLKGTDIGFNVGAGWDLPFGLDIHARYVIGLTDVNDFQGAQEQQNSMFQLSVGYSLINLGK